MSEAPAPFARRFVFRTDDDIRQFFDFMRSFDRVDLARGDRYLQAVVSITCEPMTHGQRRYMWAGILNPMEQQARLHGAPIRAKDWHRIAKILFLPETCAKGIQKWEYTDEGRVLRMSTGDLDWAEMNLYLQQLEAWAVTDYGVRLPQNPRDA